MFSSPSSSACQQISNFAQYAFGQLKISDSSMFMLGYNPFSPNQLYLYKHTFGGTSPDWSLQLSWPSGVWSVYESESQLISSSIYTLFPYGSTKYAYMAVISVSDGTVGNRYKSSISCTNIYGSGVNGDYIVASVRWSSTYYFLIFNRATNLFDIKTFSGDALYEIGLESTGR